MTAAEEKVQQKQFARWLFAQPCEFITGAAQVEQLPLSDMPEVAFAGRSNVGKSSLINGLTNRRRLAHTSNTPGRTQQINFFTLAQRLMIVDLPGYGYAKASKKLIRSWRDLITLYLKGRVQLSRVFVLIDSRHGFKSVDEKIMGLLDKAAVTYQIVLTKVDKVKSEVLEELITNTEKNLKKHPAAYPVVIATSAVKRRGIEELQFEIAGMVSK